MFAFDLIPRLVQALDAGKLVHRDCIGISDVMCGARMNCSSPLSANAFEGTSTPLDLRFGYFT